MEKSYYVYSTKTKHKAEVEEKYHGDMEGTEER